MTKKAVVLHSGGMDSSICLALAIREFGASEVISLFCDYHQRHQTERDAARRICQEWGVERREIDLSSLGQLTTNALTDHSLPIEHLADKAPNTLVMGRNGLMARLGAIFCHQVGAHVLYMGVIEVEAWNSGYRDCSRHYMDLEQEVLRLDLDNPEFEIRTPVIHMTKVQTLELAEDLGILPFLLRETITCYEGLPGSGCKVCPACLLRNEGVRLFYKLK